MIEFGGYTFTIISDKYALCDEAIAKMAFREDCEADDANVYESSDIRTYLEEWYYSKKNTVIHDYGEWGKIDDYDKIADLD